MKNLVNTVTMKNLIAIFFSPLIFAVTVCAHSNTVKIAYDADPVSLDIYEFLSGGIVQLAHMVCDPLLRRRQDDSFEPRVFICGAMCNFIPAEFSPQKTSRSVLRG